MKYRGRSWAKVLAIIAVAAILIVGTPFVYSEIIAPSPALKISLGGNTDLGERSQRIRVGEQRTSAVSAFGYEHAFTNYKPLLQSSALTVVNLETPLTDGRCPAGEEQSVPAYCSDAERTPRQLARAGVHAVSLANNHVMDLGPERLLDTLQALKAAGVEHFGAGAALVEAERPLVRRFRLASGKTQQIAIFSSFEHRPSYRGYATQNTAGVALLDRDPMTSLIRAHRKEHPKDFIIAYPHWGENFAWRSRAQTSMAKMFVHAGADLVVGTGSHSLQEMYKYQGKWIIYGLGNFVVNTPSQYDKHSELIPYSGLLQISFNQRMRRTQTLRIYLFLSDNNATGYQPRGVDHDEALKIKSALLARATSATAPPLDLAQDEFGWYLLLK